MENGASTGYVFGYGSYCLLSMRTGDKAGSLQGGTRSETQLDREEAHV